MPAMNMNRDTLMKVGIAVAVALIIYLILRSVTCSKREPYAPVPRGRRRGRERFASFVPPSGPGRWRREGYAMFVPPSGPGRWRREGYAPYAVHPRPSGSGGRRRPRLTNDYSEEEYYPEVEGNLAEPSAVTSVPPLMESTLDDAQANAEFAPDV